LEINTILNLLITYNITAEELLVVYLTFLARDEEGHPEYFSKWFSNGGSTRLRSVFESLKEKGIILKDYNPDTYDPNDIRFNKNFLKSWLKNSGEMGQELFSEYPNWVNVNGKLIPLKNVATKVNTLDEFFFMYSSAIKHNPETHKKVMEILKWAKENDKITSSILNFVVSHQWEALEDLRNNPQEGMIASTYNVYDTV